MMIALTVLINFVIISAFNFPVAVWAWNTALAWICGDVCVWKPSEKTPLTALACQFITNEVFKENNVPEGVSSLVIGDAEIGKLMANDARVPLISATLISATLITASPISATII